jgi:hypothetical protein
MVLSLSMERNSPEPEEDVDLFVDDVLGENAEAVLVLDSTGGTVLVERALRHLLSSYGSSFQLGVMIFFIKLNSLVFFNVVKHTSKYSKNSKSVLIFSSSNGC